MCNVKHMGHFREAWISVHQLNKKTPENRSFLNLFSFFKTYLNFSTPLTFIRTEVTLSTGPVMNNNLLFLPAKTLLVPPGAGIERTLFPLGSYAFTPDPLLI